MTNELMPLIEAMAKGRRYNGDGEARRIIRTLVAQIDRLQSANPVSQPLEPGVCACIPLAPRPAKYCSDCGKLIPQGASRDASSDESCTYCGRMWGDEKTTRCPLQGEELRCHARKP